MPKFSRRPEDRPTEILDAALKRFAANGFAGTKMEQVAADAGVTAGTIYRYFPSKEALVGALVERNVDLAWSRGREIADAYGSRTAREILELLLLRWADSLEHGQSAALLQMIVREAPQFPAAVKAYASLLIGPGCLALERAIRHGIDRGEFPILEIEATARGLAGIVLAGTVWQATFGEHLDGRSIRGDTLRLAINAAVRGLPRGGEIRNVPPPQPHAPRAEGVVERTTSGLRIVNMRPPRGDE
jgi:AcrR family transcriptional regulator